MKRERQRKSRRVLESQAEVEGTYQRELVRCGKPKCKRCKRGPAHGPYWYLYQWQPARRRGDSKLRSIYIGKDLQRRLA